MLVGAMLTYHLEIKHKPQESYNIFFGWLIILFFLKKITIMCQTVTLIKYTNYISKDICVVL